MEYCPMCQSEEVDLMDEELPEDGIGMNSYYSCYDCDCAWVEYTLIEILNEGVGPRE